MTLETALETRQRYADDLHRPRYHFLPPSNWMNDPNGFIQWKGVYHLFYQYNPQGPLWGNIHWGHATSRDLIHWMDHPIAMTPTPGGPDETGVFSGCAIDHDGVPTIFYTGTRGERNEIQTQCIATSDDDLQTIQKYPNNPVLGQDQIPPESGQTRDFRDPFVWKEGNVWYMVLGSRIQEVGGAVFLYRSNDLIHWEYLNPLLTGTIQKDGTVWECPNFFPLGDQWVLIISSHLGNTTGSVLYFMGKYENYRFTPTSEGVLDYGHLYAPLTTVDAQGRRLLMGWLREARTTVEQQRAGWSGTQSIPRILSLDAQGRVTMSPIPELESVRGKHHHFAAADLAQDGATGVSGLALDIVAEFNPGADGSCGLSLICQPDGKERVEIVYQNAHLVVRKVSADVGDSVNTHVREVPHALAAGEPLRLRVLLDGSVIETIANDSTSVTSRFYPMGQESVSVQAVGGNACAALDIWEMPSIWE